MRQCIPHTQKHPIYLHPHYIQESESSEYDSEEDSYCSSDNSWLVKEDEYHKLEEEMSGTESEKRKVMIMDTVEKVASFFT